MTTSDYNNLAKSTTDFSEIIFFGLCLWSLQSSVFVLEDKLKVNFWGSVNRIMKINTEFMIKQLIAWWFAQRKKRQHLWKVDDLMFIAL